MAELGACTGCGKPARYTIQLTLGTQGNTGEIRFYIPNDFVRQEAKKHPELIDDVAFCATCMRVIEDNLRATIGYLRSENDLPPRTGSA